MNDTVREMIAVVDKVLDDPELSEMVVRRMVDHFGGMSVYLPKTAFKEDESEAIYRAFNGHNHREVVRTFGISITRLYDILRAQNKPRDDSSQGRLGF